MNKEHDDFTDQKSLSFKNEAPGARVPEKAEMFDDQDTLDYLTCDNSLTADYAIVAGEIALKFGQDGRLNGGVIAEVCPGPGNLCGEIHTIGADKVIGIDGSTLMLNHASSKFEKEIADGTIEFKLGEAQRLPLENNSVDGIVNFNSFHQFNDVPRALLALKEMVRVLRPGGWGLVRDFKRGADPALVDERSTITEVRELLKDSLKAAFTKNEFIAMLEQIDGISFEVIDAPNPWRLPESVCERIRKDPVRHWMDAEFSQHIIIHKF